MWTLIGNVLWYLRFLLLVILCLGVVAVVISHYNTVVKQQAQKQQDDAARKLESQRRVDKDVQAAAREKQVEEQAVAERQVESQRRIARDLQETMRKKQIEDQAVAEQTRRANYLLITNLPAKLDFIVCAATATKEPLAVFAAALTKQVQFSGKTASSSVFAPAFITDGGFELFHAGKGCADIQALPLSKMGGKLLLARCDDVSSKASATVPGLVSSTVRISISVLDTSDGRIVEGLQLSAVGPGTSEADAKTAAFDRILEQVSKRSL